MFAALASGTSAFDSSFVLPKANEPEELKGMTAFIRELLSAVFADEASSQKF